MQQLLFDVAANNSGNDVERQMSGRSEGLDLSLQSSSADASAASDVSVDNACDSSSTDTPIRMMSPVSM